MMGKLDREDYDDGMVTNLADDSFLANSDS